MAQQKTILKVDSPFLTSSVRFEQALRLWDATTETYTPGTLKWRGDPSVQPGDYLAYPGADGNTHYHLVTSQTIHFGGGFYIESECAGTANYDASITI